MARPFPKSKGFLCYVDESGCEGFRFGRGSSDWFVLAAVVTRQSFDEDITTIVDEVRKELLWPPDKTSGQRPDYAEILLPRLYRHKGEAWGNGLKIVPREAVHLVDGDEALAWCKAVKENR